MTYDVAIKTARKRRARLHETMCELEAAITVPARASIWAAELSKKVKAVEGALIDHIEDVESPNGIIAGILEDAPRLSAHAQILLDDHPRLRRQVEEVSGGLAGLGPAPEADEVGTIRESVLELLGELTRHRSLGADFVYDAYSFDIGGQS